MLLSLKVESPSTVLSVNVTLTSTGGLARWKSTLDTQPAVINKLMGLLDDLAINKMDKAIYLLKLHKRTSRQLGTNSASRQLSNLENVLKNEQ